MWLHLRLGELGDLRDLRCGLCHGEAFGEWVCVLPL